MTQKVGGVEFDVIVDSSGAISASKNIISNNELLEDSFEDVEEAAKRSGDGMEKGAKKGAKAVGGLGRKAGQAGIQVQQLVGQIQGGQNVFNALSAQAADLGIVLGAPLLGAVAGLGAAFAGVLLPSLFDTEDKTQDLIDKLRELAETKILSKEQAALLAQEERKLIKEKEDSRKATEEEITEQQRLIKVMENSMARNANSQAAYDNFRKSIKKAKEEIVFHKAALKSNNDELEESKLKLDFYTASMHGNIDQTKKQKEQIESLVTSFANQADAIGKTNRQIAIRDAMQKGANEDQLNAINIAFDAIEAEENRVKSEIQGVRDTIQAERDAHKERIRMQKESEELEAQSQQRVSAVEKIKQEMATEAELRDQKFASDIEALRAALDNEELTKAEYDALELERATAHANQLISIEERTAQERANIEKRYNDTVASFRNSAIRNAMGLLDTFAGESKIAAIAAIAINKGLALAQNTQNTLTAQTRALAELGPVAGPPMAAKIGAYGAINAGLIAATGLAQASQVGRGGSTFSGGVQSTNVSSNTSAQGQLQPDRNISISLAGDSFSGSSVRGLIDAINEELGDGATLTTGG